VIGIADPRMTSNIDCGMTKKSRDERQTTGLVVILDSQRTLPWLAWKNGLNMGLRTQEPCGLAWACRLSCGWPDKGDDFHGPE